MAWYLFYGSRLDGNCEDFLSLYQVHVPSPVEFMYKKRGINKRAQNAGPNLLVALASLREACNPKSLSRG